MRYAGVVLDFDSRGGHRDGHFINFIKSESSTAFDQGSDGSIPEGGTRLIDRYGDSHQTFFYEEIKSQLQDNLNTLDSRILFTWGYAPYHSANFTIFNNDKNSHWYEAPNRIDNYSRVWWRTSFNDWAVFPKLFLKSSNRSAIKTFIQSSGIPDIHFAYYKQESLANIGLYAPDQSNRTINYFQPYNIYWEITINDNIFSIPNNFVLPISGEQYKFNEDEITFDTQSYSLNIFSSEVFEDIVAQSLSSELEGIDVEGFTKDSKGNSLNPSSLYLKINNKLMYYTSDTIAVSDVYGGTRRSLVYNQQTLGTPNERYDSCSDGDEDDHTTLDYNGVNVVRV